MTHELVLDPLVPKDIQKMIFYPHSFETPSESLAEELFNIRSILSISQAIRSRSQPCTHHTALEALENSRAALEKTAVMHIFAHDHPFVADSAPEAWWLYTLTNPRHIVYPMAYDQARRWIFRKLLLDAINEISGIEGRVVIRDQDKERSNRLTSQIQRVVNNAYLERSSEILIPGYHPYSYVALNHRGTRSYKEGKQKRGVHMLLTEHLPPVITSASMWDRKSRKVISGYQFFERPPETQNFSWISTSHRQVQATILLMHSSAVPLTSRRYKARLMQQIVATTPLT